MMNNFLVRRVLFGLLLIGIGVIFMAGQLGIIEIDLSEIIPTYWPVILIILGLSGMIGAGGRQGSSGFMWNLFVVLLGAGFLLRNLGVLSMDIGDLIKLLIPFFIILFGIRMIIKPNTKPTNDQAKDYSYKYEFKYDNYSGAASPPPPSATPPSYDPSESPNYGQTIPPNYDSAQESYANGENRSGFIGDLYLGHDYWELKPMNVSHFIGDTTIDLTKAQIPFGETRLNISAFIGDVKVFVPNDLDVEFSVNSSSFLGDITVFDRREGGFLRSMSEETPSYLLADKKIKLQCNLFIGDIHVQRVG